MYLKLFEERNLHMNEKKIAIFKLDNNEFEKYYNEKLKEFGCEIFSLDSFLIVGKNRKPKVNLMKINNINFKKYDLIIVFEVIKLIPFIKCRISKKCKLILWNWNKQNSMFALKAKFISFMCEIWTFDPNDAKTYGWKLNNQFYIPDDNLKQTENINITAFCACLDKGRYCLVKKIRESLLKENVLCDFTLIKDGTSVYSDQDNFWVKNIGLPYSVFLKHALQSNIIIDLVQNGQTGLTVRTLEALFYDKKLITNNVDVAKYPFYRDSNIFIWTNKIDELKLKKFLHGEYKIINASIKEKYTYKEWLNNFLKNRI